MLAEQKVLGVEILVLTSPDCGFLIEFYDLFM